MTDYLARLTQGPLPQEETFALYAGNRLRELAGRVVDTEALLNGSGACNDCAYAATAAYNLARSMSDAGVDSPEARGPLEQILERACPFVRGRLERL